MTLTILFYVKVEPPEVSLEEEESFDRVKGRAPSRSNEKVQHQIKSWQQLDAHQKHNQHTDEDGKKIYKKLNPYPAFMSRYCRAELCSCFTN